MIYTLSLSALIPKNSVSPHRKMIHHRLQPLRAHLSSDKGQGNPYAEKGTHDPEDEHQHFTIYIYKQMNEIEEGQGESDRMVPEPF